MTDAALRALEERVTAHDRRLTELRAEDMRRLEDYKQHISRALELQATEYERRMEILNGAHEEARRVLGTYVTKIEYEKNVEVLYELKRRVSIIFNSAAIGLVFLTLVLAAWKLWGDP